MVWTDRVAEVIRAGEEAARQESAALLSQLLPLPLAARRAIPLEVLTSLTHQDARRFIDSLNGHGPDPEESAVVLTSLLRVPVEQRRNATADDLSKLTQIDLGRLMLSMIPPAPIAPVPVPAVPPAPVMPSAPPPPRRKTRLGPAPAPRISWPVFHAIEWAGFLWWWLPRRPLLLALLALMAVDAHHVFVLRDWGGYDWHLAWIRYYLQNPDALIRTLQTVRVWP